MTDDVAPSLTQEQWLAIAVNNRMSARQDNGQHNVTTVATRFYADVRLNGNHIARWYYPTATYPWPLVAITPTHYACKTTKARLNAVLTLFAEHTGHDVRIKQRRAQWLLDVSTTEGSQPVYEDTVAVLSVLPDTTKALPVPAGIAATYHQHTTIAEVFRDDKPVEVGGQP